MHRQALWFAQRAAEQEKESVLQQLQSAGLLTNKQTSLALATAQCASHHFHLLRICHAGFTNTNSNAPPQASVRSEDVLDQLTQRITGQL